MTKSWLSWKRLQHEKFQNFIKNAISARKHSTQFYDGVMFNFENGDFQTRMVIFTQKNDDIRTKMVLFMQMFSVG